MLDLILKATESTPNVFLSAKDHTLDFKGTSFPENAILIYEPVFKWLKNYNDLLTKDSADQITCNCNFRYLNSASYIILRDIIENLLDISEANNIKLELNWFYATEDDDMYELAQEMKDLLDITFNYHEYSIN